MSEFFSWEFLASFAGAAVATGILTQFLKKIKIPTQILSYIVAFGILLLAKAFTSSEVDLSEWTLIPLNAALVSLASNGKYMALKRLCDGGEKKV